MENHLYCVSECSESTVSVSAAPCMFFTVVFSRFLELYLFLLMNGKLKQINSYLCYWDSNYEGKCYDDLKKGDGLTCEKLWIFLHFASWNCYV